jgi:hypothetical protein
MRSSAALRPAAARPAVGAARPRRAAAAARTAAAPPGQAEKAPNAPDATVDDCDDNINAFCSIDSMVRAAAREWVERGLDG